MDKGGETTQNLKRNKTKDKAKLSRWKSEEREGNWTENNPNLQPSYEQKLQKMHVLAILNIHELQGSFKRNICYYLDFYASASATAVARGIKFSGCTSVRRHVLLVNAISQGRLEGIS